MSYEKTNWVTGDIVTADKLNKLEDGVANADGSNGRIKFIEVSTIEGTSDMAIDLSFNELNRAINSRMIPVAVVEMSERNLLALAYLDMLTTEDGFYAASFHNQLEDLDFFSVNPDTPMTTVFPSLGGDTI